MSERKNFHRMTQKRSTIIGKIKDIDPFNFEKKSKDTFKIEEDYLTKEGCTSMILGPEPIMQNCYICSICNPEKNHYICKYCYNTCHLYCRRNDNSNSEKLKEENNFLNDKEFGCYCGIRLKHKPDKIIRKELISCNLIELDNVLDIDNFFCETHNINICCICSVTCHKDCQITKNSKHQIITNKNANKCLCESDNHTSYNEIALSFPLNEYQKLSGIQVWPIQILNILFKNQNIFQKMSNLFTYIMNQIDNKKKNKKKKNKKEHKHKHSKDKNKDKEDNNEDKNKEDENKENEDNENSEMKEKFLPLLQLFSNTFNRKFKTFYYIEEIENLFEFEKLIYHIEIKDEDRNNFNPKNILIKFRLTFILLFIYLRKDFQIVKSLTSVDFLTNNILERIYYKKILTEKYNLKNLFNKKNTLKKLVLEDICFLMEEGMSYVSIEENQEEFEIGLKFICFVIKRMIFTKEDLIQLIYSLDKFYSKFNEYITSDKNNIYSLLDIFMGLAEIFFMITVSYNDIIIMDYLDENKNQNDTNSIKEIKDFIHVNSDYGNLLFKMVLKSCDILKKHYNLIKKKEIEQDEEEKKRELIIHQEKKRLQRKIEERTTGVQVKLPKNGGLFTEKIINLFNETLKMFSLADNIYYYQINSIKKDSIEEYYYFTERIKRNKGKKLKSSEIKKINGLLENDLKKNIEKELFILFTSSYQGESLRINKKIFDLILDFSKKLEEIFPIESKEKKKHHHHHNEEEDKLNINKDEKKNKFERYNQEYALDEDQFFNRNGKNIGDYLVKLAKKNSMIYKCFLNDKFHTYIEDFVDCLIMSHIDETLGKVLVFLSNRKFPNLLTYELLDVILFTFSFFFFSKRGIKYFLMGKNISRLNKVFNRFYCYPDNKNIHELFGKNLDDNLLKINRLLEFMTSMIKGMNLYSLSLKNHKVLLRFKNKLLEHIEEFNQILKKFDYSEEFKIQFTYILRIFKKLSHDYEFEQFEEIKHRIILIFHKCPLKLLEKDTFSSFFSFEEEKKQNEDEHLAKNIMKKVEEDHISEIDTSLKPQNRLILKENSVASVTNDKSNNNKPPIKSNDIILDESKYQRKISLNLYFAFFNLIGLQTFYHFNTEDDITIFNKMYNFNDFQLYKKIFSLEKITIKQKVKILKFCRSIYFIDKLDYYNILLQKRHLTTNNYIKLLETNTIDEPNINDEIDFNHNNEISNEEITEIKYKFDIILQIEQILDLYILELKKFPFQIKGIGIDSCLKLIKELLLGIKFIANFFYLEKEIWSRLGIKYYELCIEFLPKIEIFKKIYKEIKNKQYEKVFNIDFTEFEKIDSEHLYINIDYDPNPPIKNKKEQLELNKKKKETKEKLLEIKKNIDSVHSTSFNIYNTNQIFKYITEGYEEIIKYTEINRKYNFQSFLEVFDTMAEANFTPFSLIETLDYEYFYEEESIKEEKEQNKDPEIHLINNMKKSFFITFIDIPNTNFFKVFTKVSNDTGVTDYRKKIIDYFQSFLNSVEGNNSKKLEDLLCIITKLLYYDVEEMQSRFEYLINDKYFFINFNKLLSNNIVISFSLFKNNFSFDKTLRIGNLTKLIIQFLQSLGENFNTIYHDNIFKFQEEIPKKEKKIIDKENEEEINVGDDLIQDLNSKKIEDTKQKKGKNKLKKYETYKTISTAIPDSKVNHTIYESIVFNLKRTFYFLDMDNLIDGRMPYDKLITLTTNFIDFLIEYIETTEDNNKILEKNMKKLFFGMKDKGQKNIYELIDYKPLLNAIFIKIKPNKNDPKLYLIRKKVICYVKMKFVQLLTSYLQTEKKDEFVIKISKKKCSPIDLFQEILYNFKELLSTLKRKNEKLYNSLEKIKDDEKYVNQLINYYAYQRVFREIIELPLCLKLYILIKTFEDLYGDYSIKDLFERLVIDETMINDNIGIRSKFSKRVYMFLEKIILKVEIRFPKEQENDNFELNNNKDLIVKNVIDKININNDMINDNNNEKDIEENYYNNNKYKITFFIRPYLTFSLSKNSKISFVKNVDRRNATSKFMSLISYTDYFLFEMVVNIHTTGSSKFKSFLVNLNFKIIEIINYLFIIAQNILLMYHYYRSPDLDISLYEEKDESLKYHLFRSNLILSIIQIVYLLLFLFIWYYFRYSNSYQLNLMQLYNHNFVFKKKNEDTILSQNVVNLFRQDEKISVLKVQSEINKKITTSQMLYNSIIESTLINRDMNILLYSFLLNILYLSTKSSLFLIFQTLFILNIIPTLFNIFQAIKIKLSNILLVLTLEIIIIYLFMWFSYFYLSDLFTFDNILERESQEEISESFCYSPLQCLLFLIQKGVTAGGGIGEIIDKVSFQSDMAFYLIRFFYDMLFFVLIVLVLGNVFLGIIVDTFSQLRDENYNKEYDKKNICFICQLNRDDCLSRNIDFNKHVKGIHNLWNYVYFLCHLHINNPNDFNRIELVVWDKLCQQDFSWIPIEKSED